MTDTGWTLQNQGGYILVRATEGRAGRKKAGLEEFGRLGVSQGLGIPKEKVLVGSRADGRRWLAVAE